MATSPDWMRGSRLSRDELNVLEGLDWDPEVESALSIIEEPPPSRILRAVAIIGFAMGFLGFLLLPAVSPVASFGCAVGAILAAVVLRRSRRARPEVRRRP